MCTIYCAILCYTVQYGMRKGDERAIYYFELVASGKTQSLVEDYDARIYNYLKHMFPNHTESTYEEAAANLYLSHISAIRKYVAKSRLYVKPKCRTHHK